MSGLLRRLAPRTLWAQMVLLLAAAVFLAKAGSWYAYQDERAFAVQRMHVDDSLGRIAATVRLMSVAPEDLHKDAIEAISSLKFRFWWGEEPAIPAMARLGDVEAGERLKALVGDGAREVRVKIIRPNGADMAEPDGTEDVKLKVSVQLPNGRWLNAATYQVVGPSSMNGAMLSSTLAAAAMVALVALFISRRIARPLREIGEAAERLGRGEAVELDEGKGPTEVRRAAAAFNAMGNRLRRFVDDRTRMLAAVSHDLRTPITNLRLRVEMLEEGETKARMLHNVEELRQTAEAMLAFAREEAGEESRPADLVSLVESLCDDMADLGAPVSFEGVRKLPIVCRPAALRRVIRNLVENAVAYGGIARVTVTEAGNELRVTVEDDGPGIAGPEMERVFEPFVRLEASRNRRTGGVGLGLSIARSIARGHGGDILLENRAEGGLRAVLILPAGLPPAGPKAGRTARRFPIAWHRSGQRPEQPPAAARG